MSYLFNDAPHVKLLKSLITQNNIFLPGVLVTGPAHTGKTSRVLSILRDAGTVHAYVDTKCSPSLRHLIQELAHQLKQNHIDYLKAKKVEVAAFQSKDEDEKQRHQTSSSSAHSSNSPTHPSYKPICTAASSVSTRITRSSRTRKRPAASEAPTPPPGPDLPVEDVSKPGKSALKKRKIQVEQTESPVLTRSNRRSTRSTALSSGKGTCQAPKAKTKPKISSKEEATVELEARTDPPYLTGSDINKNGVHYQAQEVINSKVLMDKLDELNSLIKETSAVNVDSVHTVALTYPLHIPSHPLLLGLVDYCILLDNSAYI